MQPIEFLNLAAAIVGALFGLLTVVVGWIGNKLYGKLESIEKKINKIENELRQEIHELDRRVTRLETYAEIVDHG